MATPLNSHESCKCGVEDVQNVFNDYKTAKCHCKNVIEHCGNCPEQNLSHVEELKKVQQMDLGSEIRLELLVTGSTHRENEDDSVLKHTEHRTQGQRSTNEIAGLELKHVSKVEKLWKAVGFLISSRFTASKNKVD